VRRSALGQKRRFDDFRPTSAFLLGGVFVSWSDQGVKSSTNRVSFEIDSRSGQPLPFDIVTNQTRTCPNCKAPLVLALPRGGGPRTLRCLECERLDPMKSDKASGWLQGELRRPR
jgi:hypothetical protein